MKKVLVTGMSGLIGSVVRERLGHLYQLSALNRRVVPGVPTTLANVANLDAILPAFDGVDAVVHLACHIGADDEWDAMLSANIAGTYNVYEAARLSGVNRVVLGGAAGVVMFYQKEAPFGAIIEGRYDEAPFPPPTITRNWPVRPFNIYGCTKVWSEAVARYYADAHGIASVVLRIGRVPHDDRPAPGRDRDFVTWCSHRDIARAIQRGLDAPLTEPYVVVDAVSRNRWGIWDYRYAEEAIGYVPQDSADDFR